MFEPENFDDTIAKSLGQFEDGRTVWLDIADTLGVISTNVMQQQGTDIIDAAGDLLEVVLGRFAIMSDAELRAQSRIQQRLAKKIRAFDGEVPIEQAFHALELIRDVFSPKEFDSIVKAHTRVVDKAHKELPKASP